MQSFIVTIEGPNWEDVEEVELPQLPGEGTRSRRSTALVS
jgi:hypothetical protein